MELRNSNGEIVTTDRENVQTATDYLKKVLVRDVESYWHHASSTQSKENIGDIVEQISFYEL